MDRIFNAKTTALTGANPETAAPGSAVPRRRTGGRSARVLEAVERAVIDELKEFGIEDFSIPRVASRAGISSSSLYRRWANKAALIAFAGGRTAQQGIPFPDCGSLRDDLVRVLVEVAATFGNSSSRAMIALAFSSNDSPEIQQTQAAFWQQRVEQQRPMFERAIARGEIDARVDTGAVIERVVGPLYFRYFVMRQPASRRFMEDLVDVVLQTLPLRSA